MSRFCVVSIGIALLAVAGGCGDVTWRGYHGEQNWATGSGFRSETKDGLLIYEGLPDHPYEVLGIVEAQGPANFLTRPAHREKMHKLIREHSGDGMIIVGRELIRTGSSGTYQGQAYSNGNAAQGTGTASFNDQYNYAMAVLAIRLSKATTQPSSREGRDPAEWARSVLAGGTAFLGAETGK